MSTPVLVDTDPGNDDAVLLALAAAAPAVDVVGATTVAGNAGLAATTRNARAVLEWAGLPDVPVVPGADRPLVREAEPAPVHGPDGLYGTLPEPEGEPAPGHAARTIVETARAHEGDLTLVAVGPLTNVALALALEPALPDLLSDLYVMGGAAMTGGNVTPMAEYNFYHDPEAARRVVRDGEPRLVGLDVTDRARLRGETLRDLAAGPDPLRTVAGWLAYTDPADVADALDAGDPPGTHDATVGVELLGGVLEFERHHATVETCGSCRGTLVVDDRGVTGGDPNVDVAVDIDVPAFRETLLSGLRRLER
jgi:inosine-uridine nucleoside N-ribohydrolase